MLIAYLALLLPTGTPADLAKCSTRLQVPGYAAEDAVVLVDGTVLAGGLPAFADMPEPYYVDVTCWNPDKNVFHSTIGVPVVRVITHEAARASRGPLTSLVSAQAAYHEEHGRYATELAALEGHGFSAAIHVDFMGGEGEWTASNPPGATPYLCVATQDSVAQRDANGEPQLTCSSDDAVGLDDLQMLYKDVRPPFPSF